ncbi:VG15 protein [Streptomyces sp. NPDC003691]
MTAPAARHAETDQATEAFHTALAQIGAETAAGALALWADVPADLRGATAGAWLRRAITLVMGQRRRSRDLARAFYRLARALQTGRTVADPYHPEPTHVTLADLRREFAALAGPSRPAAPAGGGAATGEPGEAPHLADQDERVLVEELPGLRESEELIERQAEEELATVLEALGTLNLNRKLAEVDDGQPARDADRERAEAHQQSGAQQAAAAARVAMNGARSTTWNHMRRDGRAMGYVRLSKTGTPCGWCAMLISRGATYKSRESATFADGDKFHDNCLCYAVPVFSRQQFQGSELMALSREYGALWPTVTKGLSGKAAVSAWRRFIRQKHRAAAQEAARQSTDTAQEA